MTGWAPVTGSAPAKVGAGSAAAAMEMVVEWAAATVVAETARAATAAAMELVVRAAAAQAGATGRVRTGKAAAAAKVVEATEEVG